MDGLPIAKADDDESVKKKTAHNKENENEGIHPPAIVDNGISPGSLLTELPIIKKDISLQSVSASRPTNVDYFKRHIPVVYAPAKPTTLFRKEVSTSAKRNQYVPVVPDHCPKPLQIDYKPSTAKSVNSESEYQPQSLSCNNSTASYTPSQAKINVDAQTSPISYLPSGVDSEEEDYLDNKDSTDFEDEIKSNGLELNSHTNHLSHLNSKPGELTDSTEHKSNDVQNSKYSKDKPSHLETVIKKECKNASSRHSREKKDQHDHNKDSSNKVKKSSRSDTKETHSKNSSSGKGSKEISVEKKSKESKDSRKQSSSDKTKSKDSSKSSHKHTSKSRTENSRIKEEKTTNDPFDKLISDHSSQKKKSSSKSDKSPKTSNSKNKSSTSSSSSSGKHRSSSSHSSKSNDQSSKHSHEKRSSSHRDHSKREKEKPKRSSSPKISEKSKRVKLMPESNSSSDVEIATDNIVISDSSDEEPIPVDTIPSVSSSDQNMTVAGVQDSSPSLYERWMKARETINKNPQGRMRIAHVPNVSSLLSAKSKLISKMVKQVSQPIKPVPVNSEFDEPQAVKRKAHIPKAYLEQYPTVKPDDTIKILTPARQACLNNLFEEFSKYFSPDDASERAVDMELNIAKRMHVKKTYRNAVALSILRIRKNKGHVVEEKPKEAPIFSSSTPPYTYGLTVYECSLKYLITEQDIEENGFPRSLSDHPGYACLNVKGGRLPQVQEGQERTCVNCKNVYTLDKDDMPIMDLDCIYHWGKLYRVKGSNGLWTHTFSCCNKERYSDGCETAQFHLSNSFNWSQLGGFVSTTPYVGTNENFAGIFALDCEMCHTTKGIELTRCTVVDLNGKVVFDKLVRPDNPILDYCTRFSGIKESDMDAAEYTLKDVQIALLTLFNDKTILIGHSLENDLKVLRLTHGRIVDTSILFPHRKGLPYKRSLRMITKEYLGRDIQIKDSGHDSKEDAIACLDLVLWKIKEDCKARKPRVIISLPGKQARKPSTDS